MNLLSKILMIIFALIISVSCNETEIEEFNLVRGDIQYGPGSNFTFVDDLDNNAYSEVIYVSNEDKQNHQFNHRIYIVDFDSYSPIHSEVIRTVLKDVKAYDFNNDGIKEILYTYQNKDSLFLKIYNPFSGEILLHSKIQVAEFKIDGRKWAVGCRIENFADLNGDGFPEIILTLAANYSKQPRGILVFDVKNQKELWHYWVGPFVYPVKTYDFNNDGKLEIYFNSASPGNGSEANGTDDYHTYFIVLSNEGKLLFQAELGKENSATYVYVNEPFGKTASSLITITRENNFNYYNTFQNLIWKWDEKLNFHIISKSDALHLDGEPIPIIYNEKPSIILTNQLRQLCILDTTLKLVKTLPHKFKFGAYLGAFDLNYDGVKEYVWNAGQDGLMLFDSDYKIIGKLPRLNKIFEIQEGRRKHVKYAALDREGMFFDFTLERPSATIKIISNPLVIGIAVLTFINIFLLFLLFFKQGNWKWYRKQLQYFDEALSGLILIDNKDAIIACNKRCSTILGKNEDEIKSKNYREVFDGKYTEIREWITECKITRTNSERLFRIRDNNSELVLKIYVQFIISLIKKPEGVVLIINDVMPTIQSQKTAVWLTIAQKLAHQIKNPLSTVKLTLQRVQMEFEDKPELKNSLGKIVGEGLKDARTIQKVTDDFMKFSQLEKTTFTKVQLKYIILNLIDKYLLQLEKPINIKTEIDDNIPPVYADETQISSAIMNLMDNAIYSIASKGEIIIRLKYSEIINPEMKNLIDKYIDIEISDTGKGMNVETLKRIFEPFYTGREGGSGLGLIIAKRIIEEHNGTININSREGIGTTVHIRLPIQGSD